MRQAAGMNPGLLACGGERKSSPFLVSTQAEYAKRAELARAELASALGSAPSPEAEAKAKALAAFYVQASGGLGELYAPVWSLTAGDAERPGLLGYIKGLRFIRIEAFDTDAAVTTTELLRFGHSWDAPSTLSAACRTRSIAASADHHGRTVTPMVQPLTATDPGSGAGGSVPAPRPRSYRCECLFLMQACRVGHLG
ncbi:hypothetical protein ACGF3J_38435 [Streptomyces sp. NPDC048171]|uniref:hypothetical protein n=1 Tax=Streptomyces sp. NPDC048171 TaxID=3365504 RepID=UPI0037155E35